MSKQIMVENLRPCIMVQVMLGTTHLKTAGEYELENFQNLNVNFIDFLKITLIIKKYEEDLDSEIQQKKFIKELNSVKEGIYDIFPYAYF